MLECVCAVRVLRARARCVVAPQEMERFKREEKKAGKAPTPKKAENGFIEVCAEKEVHVRGSLRWQTGALPRVAWTGPSDRPSHPDTT